MARFEATRDAFSGCLKNRRLWVIQFLVNPLLFLLFVGWLRIPVAKVWQLGLNAMVAALVIGTTLVIHGGTLVYFCERYRSDGALLKDAFKRALRNVAAMAVWVCVFYVFWYVVDKLDNYEDAVPTYVRSMLPAFLRRHITLDTVTKLFDASVFALRWIVTPGLLLPLAASAASLGFRGYARAGFSAWKRTAGSIQYWGIIATAAVLGVYVSGLIIDWTPRSETSTYTSEIFSLVLRLLVAYLLVLFSWLLACSMIGRRCGIREGTGGNSAA